MEPVLIAASYDKICHNSTFDRGCAIVLDDAQLQISFSWFYFFPICIKFSIGKLCLQVVCGHLDDASSLSLACASCQAFHNVDVGDVVVHVNYSLHSFGVCGRYKYWSQSSKYLFAASEL